MVRRTTVCHFTEAGRYGPTVRVACADISLNSFANVVITGRSVLETRWFRVEAGHGESDLEEYGLD